MTIDSSHQHDKGISGSREEVAFNAGDWNEWQVKLSSSPQFRVPAVGYMILSSLKVKSGSKKACYEIKMTVLEKQELTQPLSPHQATSHTDSLGVWWATEGTESSGANSEPSKAVIKWEASVGRISMGVFLYPYSEVSEDYFYCY